MIFLLKIKKYFLKLNIPCHKNLKSELNSNCPSKIPTYWRLLVNSKFAYVKGKWGGGVVG